MQGPWLGARRGYFADWLTQRWVRLTGKKVQRGAAEWLEGPSGGTRGIGLDFYARLAQRQGLELVTDPGAGLMEGFGALDGPRFDAGSVAPEIAHFYEQTMRYRLDVWSQWRGAFRLFGRALAVIFSRRLQQLNVPLLPLETSRGLRSRVLQLRDPHSGAIVHRGWVRDVPALERVVYVGDYSLCEVPGFAGPCVKVVFPLPNGNATVILWPEARPDGSLVLHSQGKRFGDPGFYFVVYQGEQLWAKYLATLRERIHVYVDPQDGELHADHVFHIWGLRYLELHYRISAAPLEALPRVDTPRPSNVSSEP